ncbi:MlaD family protein [Nocardioides dubius]|uniref:Mce/MlaD domain-containing protein n=1 Tax=Nocardioides dubius TaxID=317019 RepID=A0ABN1U1V9_9ACTN
MSQLRWRDHRARIIGTMAIVLIAGGAFASGVFADGNDDKLIVVADFEDASPLLEGNEVRIKGVLVGKIATIKQSRRGARVTMELDRNALPVHRDASATIRPVSLLGERYIELDQGSPDQPVLSDGAELATEKVTAATDLDEVLNVLDEDTSSALAALVATLGQSLDGNGAAVNDVVKALLPAMKDTKGLTEVLEGQNATINSLVTSLEKVAGGLAVDEGQSLEELVASTQSLLHTTAANETAFKAMVAELPSTLTAARKAVGNLEVAAGEATPTLRKLRPLTDDLAEVSGELEEFAAAADPALRAANPVLSKAQKLLDEAQPVAALLRQLGPDLASDLDDVDAITARVAPEMTMIMEFVRGWALTTNGRDGLGHYFRAGVVLDDGAALGLLPAELGTPRPHVTESTKDSKPPKDLLTGLLGDDGLTDQLLGGLLGLPGSLLAPKTDARGGVTGLSDKQERDALQYLLGGQ